MSEQKELPPLIIRTRGRPRKTIIPEEETKTRVLSPVRIVTQRPTPTRTIQRPISPTRGRSPVRGISPIRGGFLLKGRQVSPTPQRKSSPVPKRGRGRPRKVKEEENKEPLLPFPLQEEENKVALQKEENKNKVLSLADIPKEIMVKIASNLTPLERNQLSQSGVFMNIYMSHVPIKLYSTPIHINDFKTYFGEKRRFGITLKITELSLIVTSVDEDLLFLEPYLEHIEKLKIDYAINVHLRTGRLNISLLAKCKKLNSLHLSLSYLSPDLSILFRCENLEHLTLVKCGDDNISSLRTLKTLSVQNSNNIPILLNSISQLEKLEELNLTSILIREIPKLSTCPVLRSVKIQKCTILNDISGLIDCLDLKELYLSDTNVQNHNSISSCLNLEKISIVETMSNRWQKVDTDIFLTLSKLKELNLLRIEFISNYSFEFLFSLETLKLKDIWNNDVIPILPRIGKDKSIGLKTLIIDDSVSEDLIVLENSENLEHLEIKNCADLELIDFVKSCTKLKTLIVDNNGINKYDFLVGHDLMEKLSLDIKITTLDFLKHYPRLKYLKIVGSKLKYLNGIERCRLLEHLILLNNAGLENTLGIENLSVLKTLEIIGTLINMIPNLVGCEELTTVVIHATLLRDLEFIRDCKSVTKFICDSNNFILRLDPVATLDNLNILKIINCNNIVGIEPLVSCQYLRLFTLKYVTTKRVGISLLPLIANTNLQEVSLGGDIDDVEEFMEFAPEHMERIYTPTGDNYQPVGSVWKIIDKVVR
jgi:hypothetical protein